MWNPFSGKSKGAAEGQQSQSSRRKADDQRSTKRRLAANQILETKSKSAREDDPDRGFNPSSTSYSSTTRSAFPGTASASVASSYATAPNRSVNDTYQPPGVVRNASLEDQMPKSKKTRDEPGPGDEQGDLRERRRVRSPSPERKRDRKSRNGSQERKDKKRERREKREKSNAELEMNRGVKDYDQHVSESARGDFSAQVGSAEFVQFPGQYDGAFTQPPTKSASMSPHVPDQFPGQFPTTSAGPYRPPLAISEGGPGLAADYYGDVGQSVSEQPGIRPQQPSVIIGAEPHLQPASSVAHPPPEPSVAGGVGEAASFFNGSFDAEASHVSHHSSSPKPGSTYTTDTARPNGQYHTSSASALPSVGAAAAGAAADYYMSSQANSQEHRPHYTSSGVGSQVMGQRPQSYANNNYDSVSQYSNPTKPGKHSSSSSNAPLYAAGAAGLAASAYHHSHQHSTSQPYSQGFVSGSMAQRHRRRGPLSAFVDFFKDPEAVAQFEEYTEYIGVCRGCFAPGSSPRDAPRKHHYRRRRSNERYGSSMRVDKDSRYWSSDNEKRRKKSKSWIEAGIAGYGLAKVGESLFGQGNDFNEKYSVKSGQFTKSRASFSPDGRSYVSHGTTRKSSKRRNSSQDRIETGIASNGKIYKRDPHGSAFGAPSVTTYGAQRRSKSTSRSRSGSRDRKSGVTEAAVGAALGSSVVMSKSRRQEHSPERAFVRAKHHDGRDSPQRSRGRRRYSDERNAHRSTDATVKLEGHGKPHKSRKKQKGFFSFSNSSSSSASDTSSVDRSYRQRKSSKRKETEHDEHRKAELAVAGLGAAAAALTLENTRQTNRSRKRGDLVAVRESKAKHRRNTDDRKKPHHSRSSSEEDVWESASEGDAGSINSDLAYGETIRRRGSRGSLSSTSSGTSKWGWRWGSKKKRSDERTSYNHPSFSPLVTASAAAAGGTYPDERVISDGRPSRITMHSNSSLPLQQVYPIPTSDPSQYDVAKDKSIRPAAYRPEPVPIQHPQPITPVSPGVYTTQAPYSHTDPVTARSQLSYTQFAAPGAGSAIRNGLSQPDLPGSFSQPLSESEKIASVMTQGPREGKNGRRDSSPVLYSPGHVTTEVKPGRRSSLRESFSAVRFDLPDEVERMEEERHTDRGQTEDEAQRRIRQERREAKELEYLEHESVVANRDSRRSSESTKKRKEGVEGIPGTTSGHKGSAEHDHDVSWAVPTAVAIGSIAGAATIAHVARSDSSEDDDRRRRRRQRRARHELPERSDRYAGTSDSDERAGGRTQEKSIWQEAAQPRRSSSHEDYADFFAPTELLSKSAAYNEAVADADADGTIEAYEGPKVVTSEPSGFHDSRETPAYTFGPNGEEVNPDPLAPPWVPKLKLISPTPQPSSLDGSEAGDAMPYREPEATVSEIPEPLNDASPTSHHQLQDFQKPEYTIIEPRNIPSTAAKPLREANFHEQSGQTGQSESQLPDAPQSQVKGAAVESDKNFGDDLDFAGTVAAGLSQSGFDPSIVVDDPTFRRRESPPGSNEPEIYQAAPTEDVNDISSRSLALQQSPPRHPPITDKVPQHMPGAFDEDDLLQESAEVEPKLSKRGSRKKDKQAKRHSTIASTDQDLNGDYAENGFVSEPTIIEQEGTALVEEPDDFHPSDDARSATVSAPISDEIDKAKKKKKPKRKDSTFDDKVSAVSSTPTRDETIEIATKSKDRKGGLFGLFGQSSGNVPESNIAMNDPNTEKSDFEEPKRKSKKKSKNGKSKSNLEDHGPTSADADDDPVNTDSGRKTLPAEVSISVPTSHGPFPPSEIWLTNPKDEESVHSEIAGVKELALSESATATDAHADQQPLSFLGIRQEEPMAPDISASVKPAPDSVVDELEKPFQVEPEQQVTALRRSSSPLRDHHSPEPASISNSLPSSPKAKSEAPTQRLVELQKSDRTQSPQPTPSPTAVPFHFRLPPSSPGLARSSSSLPHTPSASEAAAVPSRPKLRPRSTEFKSSNEFRPLWLVSKHAPKKEELIEETYPSLPSSHTTSRTSSVRDADETSYGEAWDQYEVQRDKDAFWEGYKASDPEVDLGLLDSQQPTPTATSFPAAIREEMQATDQTSPSSLHPNIPQYATSAVPELGPPPLPSTESLPSSVNRAQEASESPSDLKSITLGAVFGAAAAGAMAAYHHQNGRTTDINQDAAEEGEMVERGNLDGFKAPGDIANSPAEIFADWPSQEHSDSHAHQAIALQSSELSGLESSAAVQHQSIQEQDKQDAVSLASSRNQPELISGVISKAETELVGFGKEPAIPGAEQASSIRLSAKCETEPLENLDPEEQAVQEAIASMQRPDSPATIAAFEGGNLTKDMPAAEVVERMSLLAEAPATELVTEDLPTFSNSQDSLNSRSLKQTASEEPIVEYPKAIDGSNSSNPIEEAPLVAESEIASLPLEIPDAPNPPKLDDKSKEVTEITGQPVAFPQEPMSVEKSTRAPQSEPKIKETSELTAQDPQPDPNRPSTPANEGLRHGADLRFSPLSILSSDSVVDDLPREGAPGSDTWTVLSKSQNTDQEAAMEQESPPRLHQPQITKDVSLKRAPTDQLDSASQLPNATNLEGINIRSDDNKGSPIAREPLDHQSRPEDIPLPNVLDSEISELLPQEIPADVDSLASGQHLGRPSGIESPDFVSRPLDKSTEELPLPTKHQADDASPHSKSSTKKGKKGEKQRSLPTVIDPFPELGSDTIPDQISEFVEDSGSSLSRENESSGVNLDTEQPETSKVQPTNHGALGQEFTQIEAKTTSTHEIDIPIVNTLQEEIPVPGCAQQETPDASQPEVHVSEAEDCVQSRADMVWTTSSRPDSPKQIQSNQLEAQAPNILGSSLLRNDTQPVPEAEAQIAEDLPLDRLSFDINSEPFELGSSPQQDKAMQPDEVEIPNEVLASSDVDHGKSRELEPELEKSAGEVSVGTPVPEVSEARPNKTPPTEELRSFEEASSSRLKIHPLKIRESHRENFHTAPYIAIPHSTIVEQPGVKSMDTGELNGGKEKYEGDVSLHEASDAAQVLATGLSKIPSEPSSDVSASQQASTMDISLAAAEILGKAATVTNNDKTVSESTPDASESERLKLLDNDQVQDDDSAGFTKTKGKLGKDQGSEPEAVSVEGPPAMETPVASTTTAEDVKNLLEVGDTKQTSRVAESESPTFDTIVAEKPAEETEEIYWMPTTKGKKKGEGKRREDIQEESPVPPKEMFEIQGEPLKSLHSMDSSAHEERTNTAADVGTPGNTPQVESPEGQFTGSVRQSSMNNERPDHPGLPMGAEPDLAAVLSVSSDVTAKKEPPEKTIEPTQSDVAAESSEGLSSNIMPLSPSSSSKPAVDETQLAPPNLYDAAPEHTEKSAAWNTLVDASNLGLGSEKPPPDILEDKGQASEEGEMNNTSRAVEEAKQATFASAMEPFVRKKDKKKAAKKNKAPQWEEEAPVSAVGGLIGQDMDKPLVDIPVDAPKLSKKDKKRRKKGLAFAWEDELGPSNDPEVNALQAEPMPEGVLDEAKEPIEEIANNGNNIPSSIVANPDSSNVNNTSVQDATKAMEAAIMSDSNSNEAMLVDAKGREEEDRTTKVQSYTMEQDIPSPKPALDRSTEQDGISADALSEVPKFSDTPSLGTLEDVAGGSKKSKKKKKREKSEVVLEEEEPALEAEAINSVERVPGTIEQEADDLITDPQAIEATIAPHQKKKGKKSKKGNSLSRTDDVKAATFHQTSSQVIHEEPKLPDHGTVEALPTIDETLEESVPKGLAKGSPPCATLVQQADAPVEKDFKEMEPPLDNRDNVEESSGLGPTSTRKSKKEKKKAKKSKALALEDSEVPEAQAQDPERSDSVTVGIPYTEPHETSSTVMNPITSDEAPLASEVTQTAEAQESFPSSPGEPVIQTERQNAGGPFGLDPNLITHDRSLSAAEVDFEPSAALNAKKSKKERKKNKAKQPKALDVEEEIAQTAPRIVEEPERDGVSNIVEPSKITVEHFDAIVQPTQGTFESHAVGHELSKNVAERSDDSGMASQDYHGIGGPPRVISEPIHDIGAQTSDIEPPKGIIESPQSSFEPHDDVDEQVQDNIESNGTVHILAPDIEQSKDIETYCDISQRSGGSTVSPPTVPESSDDIIEQSKDVLESSHSSVNQPPNIEKFHDNIGAPQETVQPSPILVEPSQDVSKPVNEEVESLVGEVTPSQPFKHDDDRVGSDDPTLHRKREIEMSSEQNSAQPYDKVQDDAIPFSNTMAGKSMAESYPSEQDVDAIIDNSSLPKSPEHAHKRSFFEGEGPEVVPGEEDAIEPPSKTKRTDADPPSEKIVHMEEEAFAIAPKRKKKKSKRGGLTALDEENPEQSVESKVSPEQTLENISRDVDLNEESVKSSKEANQDPDPWDLPVKTTKKGEKHKKSSQAEPEVIEVKHTETRDQPLTDQMYPSDDPILQSVPVLAYESGIRYDAVHLKSPTEREEPYLSADDHITASRQYLPSDKPITALQIDNIPTVETPQRQLEESSPFPAPPKSRKSKKQKKKQTIIWEDDTATASAVQEEEKPITQTTMPSQKVQPSLPELTSQEETFGELHNPTSKDPGTSVAHEESAPFLPEGLKDNDHAVGELRDAEVPIPTDFGSHAIETGLRHVRSASPAHSTEAANLPGLEQGPINVQSSEHVEEPVPLQANASMSDKPDYADELVVPEANNVQISSASREPRDLEAVDMEENFQHSIDEVGSRPFEQAAERAGDTRHADAAELATAKEGENEPPIHTSEPRLSDLAQEDDDFTAILPIKKSKKKSKRRAAAVDLNVPADLGDPADPALVEAIRQRLNRTRSTSRSPSPKRSSKSIDEPLEPYNEPKVQEDHTAIAGAVSAGAVIVEGLSRTESKKSGKKKKKKASSRWEEDETGMAGIQPSPLQTPVEESQQASRSRGQPGLTPPRSPKLMSSQAMEADYLSGKHDTSQSRSMNRDSAVHVSDSPIVPESFPAHQTIRDSGYQDTEASPIVGLRRTPSADRMDSTDMHGLGKTIHYPRDMNIEYQSVQTCEDDMTNPLNITTPIDRSVQAAAMSPPYGARQSPDDRSLRARNRSHSEEEIDYQTRPSPPTAEDALPLSPISVHPQDHDTLETSNAVSNMQVSHTPDHREPSPVSPSTKDRSSILFQSSPSTREALANAQPQSENPLSTSDPDHERPTSPAGQDRGIVADSPPHHSIFGGERGSHRELPSPPQSPLFMDGPARKALDTIKEYSPEDSPLQRKTRTRSYSPSPERGSRRRHERDKQQRVQSPQAPQEPAEDLTSTDDLISRMSWPAVDEEQHAVNLERSRSRNTENRAPSRQSVISPVGGRAKQGDGERRSFSGASVKSGESITAIIRTPDQVRSASGLSYRSSGTPPLRRVDRSVSGDLRAKSLAKQSEAEPATILAGTAIASSSTYDPTKDKGKEKMADVYEGWGDVHSGSPMSPTRPQSMMRKRQSMQILDLESRLDQLVSENRLLQEAKSRAERNLDDTSQDSKKQGNALREAIETRDLYLRQKDDELRELRQILEGFQSQVSQLTEVNETLTASRSLDSEHEQRYNQLEAEHAHTREQWQQSTRELDELRQQHANLSGGMEAIVKHEIEVAVEARNAELRQVRDELDAAKEQVRALQQQILASRSKDDFIIQRDEDYFDGQCQKLCQHVQQWVLRFSKFSDMKACFLASEIADEKIVDRMENAILDGSDVDNYLSDRIKRRDVFMSVVMTMIWEYIFTRYLFGMDREQRQKLKSLEKTLSEVGPPSAVSKWRATTLSLLAKRDAFVAQRAQDTEAVLNEIYGTLSTFLPPPSHLVGQITDSLRKVVSAAVDVAIEMRTQRAEYIMLPPLQPEYDTNGDLARKVYFNASLMNERSGTTSSNEALEAQQAVVRMVLFPLVVKKGDEAGVGDEEIVVCPAQVLCAPREKEKKTVRVVSAEQSHRTPSGEQSQRTAPSVAGSDVGMGGMI